MDLPFVLIIPLCPECLAAVSITSKWPRSKAGRGHPEKTQHPRALGQTQDRALGKWQLSYRAMQASDRENGFGSQPHPSESRAGAEDSPSSYTSPTCDLFPRPRSGKPFTGFPGKTRRMQRGTYMRFICGNGGRVSVAPEPSGYTTSVVCSKGGEVRVGNISRKSPHFPTPGVLAVSGVASGCTAGPCRLPPGRPASLARARTSAQSHVPRRGQRTTV